MPLKNGVNREIEIIAFHGWGLSSHFWNEWKSLIPDNVSFVSANRGYFNDPETPAFSRGSHFKLLMVHSFGLHWCPHDLFLKANAIAIFNSFEQLQPAEGTHALTMQKVLNNMVHTFQSDPDLVLSKFFNNVFYPEKKIPEILPVGSMNKELLLKDLEIMSKTIFDLNVLDRTKPIMYIEGGRDKILQIPRAERFAQLSGGNFISHFIKQAGHALPVTHFQESWSYISTMIAIFTSHGNYRR